MNQRLHFASFRGLLLFSIALIAGVITGSIVSGVVLLFQSRGMPLGELASAERACGQYLYKSDKDACIKEMVALQRVIRVVER